MSNEDNYEILAKKLDSAIPRLSPYGNKGDISKTWIEYFKVLVDPEDLKYLLKLDTPPGSTTLRRFAKKIKKSEKEALEILERLIANHCVFRYGITEIKYQINVNQLIVNLPAVKYFDYPKEKAEKLAYLSDKLFFEEEWCKTYQGSPQTKFFRVIPVQQSIKTETLIIPYDDVENLIDKARYVSLTKCMCKTRKEFLGKRKCKDKYPLETCIQLNQGAKYFVETGLGREISKEEAKELCKKFNKMGLIHMTENFNEGNHTLICNCCSCCCVALAGMIQYDNPHTVAAANYVVEIINLENCEKCETCVEKCIFNAISIEESGPIINNEKCMGCGVCVVNCPSNVIKLKSIKRNSIPKNFMELGLTIGREMH